MPTRMADRGEIKIGTRKGSASGGSVELRNVRGAHHTFVPSEKQIARDKEKARKEGKPYKGPLMLVDDLPLDQPQPQQPPAGGGAGVGGIMKAMKPKAPMPKVQTHHVQEKDVSLLEQLEGRALEGFESRSSHFASYYDFVQNDDLTAEDVAKHLQANGFHDHVAGVLDGADDVARFVHTPVVTKNLSSEEVLEEVSRLIPPPDEGSAASSVMLSERSTKILPQSPKRRSELDEVSDALNAIQMRAYELDCEESKREGGTFVPDHPEPVRIGKADREIPYAPNVPGPGGVADVKFLAPTQRGNRSMGTPQSPEGVALGMGVPLPTGINTPSGKQNIWQAKLAAKIAADAEEKKKNNPKKPDLSAQFKLIVEQARAPGIVVPQSKRGGRGKRGGGY